MAERRAPDRASPRLTRDRRLWAGFALLAGYALPLLLPPGPGGLTPADAGLLRRLFPGVPPAWMAARLLALAAGAVLVARAVAVDPVEEVSPDGGLSPAAAGELRLPLVLAALLVVASLGVAWLGRAGQLAYVALLFLPAAILARTQRFPASPRVGGFALPRGAVAVIALWIPLRLAIGWGSPRAADPVDMWLGFEWLALAVRDGRNLLVEGFHPGQTGLNQLFQGASLMGLLGLEPRFAWLQVIHALWAAAVALGIAILAATRIGRAAAPVAAACFLFSPFALSIPLNPIVLFVGPVFTIGILLLLERVLARASGAALLALGALGGLAATNPALAPVCAVALGAAGWRVVCGRPGGLALGAATALVFLAALAPALPGLAELPTMVRDFTGGRGHWVGLESVLFGQRTPFDVPELWQAGRPGPLDVPLGALLAPFAIARQPIRLWGDALFEPVGAVLAALGLVLLARRARHSAEARLGLLLLAAALAPAFVSSYDRASLTRLFAAPVLLALFAGLGFEALRRALAPQRKTAAALVTSGAVALGGTLLFDAVNPRILRASWLGIAIEALQPAPAGPRVGLLTYGGDWDLSWLHVERIASQVPRAALPWLRFQGADTLALADEGGLDLLLWSPALAADARVGEAVCARWPEAVLYTLWDRPRRSRALAAGRVAELWQPALPVDRWEMRPCRDAMARGGEAAWAATPVSVSAAGYASLRELDRTRNGALR